MMYEYIMYCRFLLGFVFIFLFVFAMPIILLILIIINKHFTETQSEQSLSIKSIENKYKAKIMRDINFQRKEINKQKIFDTTNQDE